MIKGDGMAVWYFDSTNPARKIDTHLMEAINCSNRILKDITNRQREITL